MSHVIKVEEEAASANAADAWDAGVVGWDWKDGSKRRTASYKEDPEGQKCERWTLCVDFTAKRRDARDILNETKERLVQVGRESEAFKMHSWAEFGNGDKSKLWTGEPFEEARPEGSRASKQALYNYHQRASAHFLAEARHGLRQQAELTMKLLSQGVGGYKAGLEEAGRLAEERRNQESDPVATGESAVLAAQRQQIERLQRENEELRNSIGSNSSSALPAAASEEALEAAFERGLQHGVQQERARLAALRHAAAELKSQAGPQPSQQAKQVTVVDRLKQSNSSGSKQAAKASSAPDVATNSSIRSSGSQPNASNSKIGEAVVAANEAGSQAAGTQATSASAMATEISSDEDSDEERRIVLARKEERRARKLEKRARKAARAKSRQEAEAKAREQEQGSPEKQGAVRKEKKRARDEVDSGEEGDPTDLANMDDFAAKVARFKRFQKFEELEESQKARKKQRQESSALSEPPSSGEESDRGEGTSVNNAASSSRLSSNRRVTSRRASCGDGAGYTF